MNLNEFKQAQEEKVEASPAVAEAAPEPATTEAKKAAKKGKKGSKSSAARREQSFQEDAGPEGPSAFNDEGEFKPDLEAEEYSPTRKSKSLTATHLSHRQGAFRRPGR